jgi:hypothetical protein
MDFLFLALLVAALGSIPLWIRRKFVEGTFFLVVSALILWGIFYLSTPLTVWPLKGAYGYLTILLFFIAAIIASFEDGEPVFHPEMIGAIVLVLVAFIAPMGGCGFIGHSKYASLLGEVEERVWTQDVQPKDPRHMRMSCSENAAFVAKQAFGQAGAIGSQFEVKNELVTPQLINKQFRLIVPVDFAGFWRWLYTKKIPGYIVVNGEDPTVPGTFVQLPEDKQFRYSPSAYWSHNLARHIWRKGYRNYAFTSCKLEVDDSNKEWWIVTLYKPVAAFWGPRFEGVLLVDPVSGDCIRHEPGKIPLWVDLAIPGEFVEKWVDYRGFYHRGWWNSWLGKKELTCAENPVMVYGNDGEPYWVTGQTSINTKDTSLLGLYYTDTRTAKTVSYKADGSTDASILNAVAKNEQVQYKQLHGVVPQVYNVLGTMASVVPLLNDGHMFQGVAVVNVKNVQIMGIGKDQFEAFREYDRLLSQSGHQVAPDLSRKIDRVVGTVKRITLVPQGSVPVFYLLIDGVPHSFTAGLQLSPELVFTREGDQVVITYYASGQTLEPMDSFDNQAIALESTQQEKDVASQAGIERAAVKRSQEAKTAKVNLEGLSEEELIKFQEQMEKNKKK